MLGSHIKKIREDKNISIDYLVKLSGIKKSDISKIENNKSIPSQEILIRALIRQLNISYIDLLILAGTLTEEDLDEHKQFRLGTIEVVCLMSDIGTYIKKIRENKNISIKDFEKLSGINGSSISKIENNQIRPPRKFLRRVIRPLNINYVDLLIREGTLTEKDLDEHKQFQLGTIELAVQEIVEIWYQDRDTGDEPWDDKIFNSIRSAKIYLTKNGFEAHKDGSYSKTRHFQNGFERYLFAHIHREIKPI